MTRRLTLFFITTLAAVLTVFSAALYLLADRHLTNQLDDQLGAATRTLASAAEIEPDGVEWEPASRPLTLATGPFGDQLYWAVTTEGGQVIDHSPQPGVEEFLAEANAGFQSGHRNPRRFNHAGRAWQVARVRLTREFSPTAALRPGRHRELILTVVVPLDPVHGTLRVLAVTLVVLTVTVLGVALVAARYVCQRALAPVVQMAEAARLMRTADLTERLPTPNTADELDNLGRAFNGLLDRLGEAFERERRFAGEASHQLRTPLTAVIGQLEVALRREREPEEYRRVLGSVLTQAGRLRRVVEGLLFLARSESDAGFPNLERVDLVEWLPGRLVAWAEHARVGDLVFEKDQVGATHAAIHPDLFGELLDALLDNAMKYSEPGTPVTIRTGREPKGVWVEVADHGCGVTADELPQLFRPFFRSEAARKRGVPGTGLGLAVAARIAGAMGGSIDAESESGQGSRFRVHLPATESDDAASEVVVSSSVRSTGPLQRAQ
ncbi:MAG: HAMP domain-containing histidine kinase [Planctomycetes bacterium]|nr:HAMP domain-containing histidine kinase [Planctomycetota bacterium]